MTRKLPCITPHLLHSVNVSVSLRTIGWLQRLWQGKQLLERLGLLLFSRHGMIYLSAASHMSQWMLSCMSIFSDSLQTQT